MTSLGAVAKGWRRMLRNRAAGFISLAVLAVLASLSAPQSALAAVTSAGSGRTELIWIPPGHYQPLYRRPTRDSLSVQSSGPAPSIAVPGFWLASHAVTNSEYLGFVRQHPEWRRSRARKLFVDEAYLRNWRNDLDFGDSSLAGSPVVNVSWFAARAYCATHGRQLPTVSQWEYVAAANERVADATRAASFQDRLRRWYSCPTPARIAAVRSTFRSVYGVWDMHGLVWEWTADFASALVNGESRGDEALDQSLYCGGGAANAADFRDYAAFMRYAFRSSLSARYCVANLGFREAANMSSAPDTRTRR